MDGYPANGEYKALNCASENTLMLTKRACSFH